MKFKGMTLLVLLLILPISTVLAQESTPSPDTKAKIEEIKQGVASRAAQLKQEVNEKLQNKAYIGVVNTVSTTSITLTTPMGAKIITINQDTVYEGVKKTNIKEKDYLATLGDIDDTGVLTAKKVVGLSKDDYEPKEVVIGDVTENKDSVLSVKQKNGEIIKISVSKTTILKYGPKKIVLDDIRPNLKVVAAGFEDNDEIKGTTVFVISEAPEDTNQDATPSATEASPSPSPKATPKVSPKATPKPSAKTATSSSKTK